MEARGHAWRRLAAIAAAGALAATGCGGGSEEREAVAAAEAVTQAFARGDLRAVCARMTAAARRQIGTVAHGVPTTCPRDLREARALMFPAAASHKPAVRFVGARIDGERGLVQALVDGRARLDVPVARVGDDWRLASFVGTTERAATRVARATRRVSFPPAAGRRLSVTDTSGSPCFPFFDDALAAIDGGCRAVVSGEQLAISVATSFGHYRFGHCDLDYTVLVDRRGRTWIRDVRFGSPRLDGCADLRACESAAGDSLPWRGRIARDGSGGLVHRIRACLDTCIGYHVGELDVRVVPSGARWRVEATGAAVGAAGLELHGRLTTAPGAPRLVTP